MVRVCMLQVRDCDVILVPVGGAGLIAGGSIFMLATSTLRHSTTGFTNHGLVVVHCVLDRSGTGGEDVEAPCGGGGCGAN